MSSLSLKNYCQKLLLKSLIKKRELLLKELLLGAEESSLLNSIELYVKLLYITLFCFLHLIKNPQINSS